MKIIGKFVMLQLLLWAMFCFFVSDGYADEVVDSINEAVTFYGEGRYTDAVSSLDYASQLIRQKRSEMLKELLPEPLPEWSADRASSESAGLAVLGGILSAKRVYQKGPSRVSIEITDSPALQSIMVLFRNLMLNTSGGGRLKRIGGQKAMIKYTPETREGDITVMVKDKCMVSVKGENVSEQDLMDYTSAVDYEKLEHL